MRLYVFALLFIISATVPVWADDTPTVAFGSGRMEGGIGNIYVYIDDKQSLRATYWQNLIKTAINNWMYTGVGANGFYCQGYVSSGVSGSKLDWYAENSSYFGDNGNTITIAVTKHYDYSINGVNPKNTNWYSASIHLNDPYLRRDSVSDNAAIGTFIHEIGHAFGLAHNNQNPNSIMCQTKYNRQVQRVQKVDNDALNELY